MNSQTRVVRRTDQWMPASAEGDPAYQPELGTPARLEKHLCGGPCHSDALSLSPHPPHNSWKFSHFCARRTLPYPKNNLRRAKSEERRTESIALSSLPRPSRDPYRHPLPHTFPSSLLRLSRFTPFVHPRESPACVVADLRLIRDPHALHALPPTQQKKKGLLGGLDFLKYVSGQSRSHAKPRQSTLANNREECEETAQCTYLPTCR